MQQLPDLAQLLPKPLIILATYPLLIITFFLYYSFLFDDVSLLQKENLYFQNPQTVTNDEINIRLYIYHSLYISSFEPSVYHVFIENLDSQKPFTGTLGICPSFKKGAENCKYEIYGKKLNIIAKTERGETPSSLINLRIEPRSWWSGTFYLRILETARDKEASNQQGDQQQCDQQNDNCIYIYIYIDGKVIDKLSEEPIEINNQKSLQYWFINRLLVPPGVNLFLPLLVLIGMGIGQHTNIIIGRTIDKVKKLKLSHFKKQKGVMFSFIVLLSLLICYIAIMTTIFGGKLTFYHFLLLFGSALVGYAASSLDEKISKRNS